MPLFLFVSLLFKPMLFKRHCHPRPFALPSAPMLAWLFNNLTDLSYLLSSPFALLLFGFQIWMLIHALRSREWMWAFFILVGWGLAALFYYFYVYRAAPSSMRFF